MLRIPTYARRNPLAILRLAALDTLYWSITPFLTRAALPADPKRILLVNPAHLGDLVITMTLISHLQRTRPGVEIGVLVGSWGKSVVQAHPAVQHVHLLDHPATNRAGDTEAKRRAYRQTAQRARQEIRSAKYDVAVCLNNCEPSLVPFIRSAGLHCLVGYTSAGFGPLLSQSYDFVDCGRHEIQVQAQVLEWLLGPVQPALHYRALFPRPAAEIRTQMQAKALEQGVSLERKPIVLHPGCGMSAKEWFEDRWIELARALTKRGESVVLTGAGEREIALCKNIADAAAVPNLAGKLQWHEFTALVAQARALVGVDSAAVHLAAACNVPGIVIAAGIGDHRRWFPLAENFAVLSKPVPCAPCLTRPCNERPCITEISVAQVLSTLDVLIKK